MSINYKILLLFLFAYVFFFNSQAFARQDYGVVTIDLRPEAGEIPTHLCVVSESPGPRTRHLLYNFLEMDEISSPEQKQSPSAIMLKKSSLRIKAELWGGTQQNLKSCSSSAESDCLPRVTLNSSLDAIKKLHVACTSDALLAEDIAHHEPKLIVILIEHLEGSPPAIESVKLAGGIATVGIQANLRNIVVAVRSLGGHYKPQKQSQRASLGEGESQIVHLPLSPICRWLQVEVPHLSLGEKDDTKLKVWAYHEAINAEQCVRKSHGNGSLQAKIARIDPGQQAALDIEIIRGHSSTSEFFSQRWQGPWPQSTILLVPQQIHFVWQPPLCVHRQGDCPSARLDSGIACAWTWREGECHYQCPEEVDLQNMLSLELPQTVHFTLEASQQRWSDTITQTGQRLKSYLTDDEIYIGIDVHDWQRDAVGAKIDDIEILDPNGNRRRFSVAGAKQVKIPLLSPTCEPLRYKIIGERKYVEGSAPIEHGELKIDSPEKTARIMTFHFLLIQGGLWGLMSDAPKELITPAYFTVLLQLVANFRPRSPQWSRLSGELRIGGTLGQWGYFGNEHLLENPRRVDRKVAWGRFLAEPAIVVDIKHPVALAAGVGIGWSWAIRSADASQTGRVPFLVSPSLEARFSLRRWLSLVMQTRVMLGEHTNVVIPNTGDTTPVKTYSIAGLYGLLFSF